MPEEAKVILPGERRTRAREASSASAPRFGRVMSTKGPREDGHRREPGDRGVGQLRMVQGVDRMRLGVAQDQRMAVRGRARHRLGPDRAIRAGAILDDDRLAERAGHVGAERAHQNVGQPPAFQGTMAPRGWSGKAARAGRHSGMSAAAPSSPRRVGAIDGFVPVPVIRLPGSPCRIPETGSARPVVPSAAPRRAAPSGARRPAPPRAPRSRRSGSRSGRRSRRSPRCRGTSPRSPDR